MQPAAQTPQRFQLPAPPRYANSPYPGGPRPMYHPSTPMAGGPNMQMVTGPGGAPMSSPLQMGQRMGGPIPPSMTQPGPGQYAAPSSSKKGKDKSKESSNTKESSSILTIDDGMQRVGVPQMMSNSMDKKRPAGPSDMKKKKRRMADKILPQRVRDLVPESQAYMDLLSFEKKLDGTIMRKRLDIQEALKRPMKQKRKLRIFISSTYYPAKAEGEEGAGDENVSMWELRVEGKLLDEPVPKVVDPNRPKRKFSSFFKSLVIELDKNLYGPDNHLVEWHRTQTTQETDGFQVKRPGDQDVSCAVLLMLDHQPMQFKLDSRLARLLGIHTQTRPVIISALWQYIKSHKLQDPHEREYINCDIYLEQIFETTRMKFSEIPQRLHPLLSPPDPICIHHTVVVDGPDPRSTACFDIDVEVDDTLKQQMNSFLLSTQSQAEIANLDHKIHETVDTINQLKTNRDFFLSFAKEPQEFINNWLISQTRDLKTITDVAGNPEEERHADYYTQPWTQEAVCRYFYNKVQQRRVELEQALGLHNA